MPELPDVRVGQEWADADPRSAGRRIRVLELATTTRWKSGRPMVVPAARCVIVANRDVAQHEIDTQRRPYFRDQRGKTTVIAVDRFRPTSTGYRLVAHPCVPGRCMRRPGVAGEGPIRVLGPDLSGEIVGECEHGRQHRLLSGLNGTPIVWEPVLTPEEEAARPLEAAR